MADVLNQNSTSTPLGIGENFTGVPALVTDPSIMVVAATDKDGELYVEFSIDGTNWDTSLKFNYRTGRINPPHIFEVGGRFVRIRFENSSGEAQTYLRIHSYVGSFNKLTAPINGTLAETYDAIVMRPTDYHYEVAMGKRQGRATINKWGHNENVGTGAAQIVAAWGGTFNPATDIIKTAQTFTITYNNTTDGLGTTGALSLLFTYLDENFLTQTATHVLGNTGSDVTSFTGVGINRCIVLSNGGLGYNVNDITVTATTDATTQAEIPALKSTTHQAIFHTQINHNFLVDWLHANCIKLSGAGGSPVVEVFLKSWSRVTETAYEVKHFKFDTSIENNVEFSYRQPFIFGGREVIYMEVISDKAGTEIEARYSGIEERIN